MSIVDIIWEHQFVAEDERHLESGDNPAERGGDNKSKSDNPKEKERDLESGDNPDERKKGK